MNLLDLPSDMLNVIVLYVDVNDLAAVSETNRELYQLALRRVCKIYSYKQYRAAVVAGDTWSLRRHRGRHWISENLTHCSEAGNKELLSKFVEYGIEKYYKNHSRRWILEQIIEGLAFTNNLSWLGFPSITGYDRDIRVIALIGALRARNAPLIVELCSLIKSLNWTQEGINIDLIHSVLQNINNETIFMTLKNCGAVGADCLAIINAYQALITKDYLAFESLSQVRTMYFNDIIDVCSTLVVRDDNMEALRYLKASKYSFMDWSFICYEAIEYQKIKLLRYILSSTDVLVPSLTPDMLGSADIATISLLMDYDINRYKTRQPRYCRLWIDRTLTFCRDLELEEYDWCLKLLWIDY